MSFLKKLGSYVMQGIGIVAGFGPLITAEIPKAGDLVQMVSKDLGQIMSIITQVEVFGQALGTAGPDKLKAAAPAVAQIILQSEVLLGRKVANPTLFSQGSTKIADGMADILNSLKDDVAVETKTA